MPLTTRTVTGTIVGPDGVAYGTSYKVRFVLNAFSFVGDTVILPEHVDVALAADGTFSVNLWINTTGEFDTEYRVDLPSDSRTQQYSYTFTLSSGASVDLSTLI